MNPFTDAQTALFLHEQRTDDLRREAEAFHLARATKSTGRHRRFGRASRRAQAVRAPAVS